MQKKRTQVVGDYNSLWNQAPENILKNLHKNVLQYY